MKKTILGAICLLFVIAGSAQESDNLFYKPTRHSVGPAGGITTGYGLSYRYNYNKWGFMATLSPFYLKDDNHTSVDFSSGLTFMYELIAFDISRIYLYQSNSYRYHKNEDIWEMWDHSTIPATWITEKNLSYQEMFKHGVGFGIEVIGLKRIGFNLMLGYGVRNGTESYTRDSKQENEDMFGLFPSIEGGIYYIW